MPHKVTATALVSKPDYNQPYFNLVTIFKKVEGVAPKPTSIPAQCAPDKPIKHLTWQ